MGREKDVPAVSLVEHLIQELREGDSRRSKLLLLKQQASSQGKGCRSTVEAWAVHREQRREEVASAEGAIRREMRGYAAVGEDATTSQTATTVITRAATGPRLLESGRKRALVRSGRLRTEWRRNPR